MSVVMKQRSFNIKSTKIISKNFISFCFMIFLKNFLILLKLSLLNEETINLKFNRREIMFGEVKSNSK